jgi:hypothetical protein
MLLRIAFVLYFIHISNTLSITHSFQLNSKYFGFYTNNSMVQSLSEKANSRASIQKIPTFMERKDS